MRILVVDDEPLARDELIFLLKECGQTDIVGQASDVVEAISLCNEVRPDVVFTDLRMSGPDGITLADLVHAKHPNTSVVVVSAHDDAALRAFDAKVFDYLLKPVKLERLRETVDRLIAKASGVIRESSKHGQIAIKDGDSYRVIALKDVACFEVKDLFVWAVTAQGRFAIDQSLAAVESQLDGAEFFRSHRGAIVRLSRLLRIEPTGGGTYDLVLTLDNDGAFPALEHKVPLARDRVKLLRQKIAFA